MASEATIERWEAICLSDAWRTAGESGENGGNVLSVAYAIARRVGEMTGCEVRDALADALAARGEAVSVPDRTAAGVCRINQDTVYWWRTGDELDWAADRPVWWPDAGT